MTKKNEVAKRVNKSHKHKWFFVGFGKEKLRAGNYSQTITNENIARFVCECGATKEVKIKW